MTNFSPSYAFITIRIMLCVSIQLLINSFLGEHHITWSIAHYTLATRSKASAFHDCDPKTTHVTLQLKMPHSSAPNITIRMGFVALASLIEATSTLAV